MSKWEQLGISFSTWVEDIMIQQDNRIAGDAFCEDPHNPNCACSSCEEAEENSVPWEIFILDNPTWRAITEENEEEKQ